MRSVIYLFVLLLWLSLPPLALAAGMSSPAYKNVLGTTGSGAGAASSPGYSAKSSLTGTGITIAPGTSSPGYSLEPGIPARAGGGTGPSGDINGDGSVTIADALLALQISVGSVTASGDHLKNGDVAPFVGGQPAPDGAVTVADALVILRKVVGLVYW